MSRPRIIYKSDKGYFSVRMPVYKVVKLIRLMEGEK